MANEKPTIPLPGATPPVPEPSDGEAEELAPGARAGGWELHRMLARGGHGTVYVAARRDGGRQAAVKILSRAFAASPQMAGRFVREARILSRLRHPNVVEILELGMLSDGRPFVAMELLDGKNLLELLGARGRLTLPEALEVLGPVCAALDAVHRAGVVHRDVKASNVFVEAGDPPRVKLLDFGVARTEGAGDPALTAVGERVGSGHAMAPELIRGGPVDARADVYALGVLLYQILTGVLPFWSDDPFELERLHLAAPPPRPGRIAPVPATVDAVVVRALAKRPEDRFSSASAFLEALRDAAGETDRTGERSARAAAIHVAILHGAALDEDVMVALAGVEDVAADRLEEAGWELDIRAGGTLLATRILPAGAPAAREARRAAVELGRALQADLAVLASAAGQVELCVHAGEVRLGPGEKRAGGPIYRTAQWVVPAPSGFLATPQALEGLSARTP